MSTYKKNKYYQLRREWKEHKQEYNNINKLYETIEKQFVINVIKFCQDNNLANPFSESSPETQNVGGDVNSSSFKSLYRKIAVSTHPDKNKNKEDARDIYESATFAKKQGNLQELLDAGKKANIKLNIDEISLEELKLLESNINDLKQKTNKIKNSYPWVWFHSNPSKRNMIFYDFIESSSTNN
jgi:hypothetical protein